MITKIAITDDHVMVLKGIESLLANTKEIDVVATYCNAQETLDGLKKVNSDVLLLDINLPDLNGIDLSKQLLKQHPDLKIIALTNFEDISFVKRMLKNGVHGYLLKNTDKIELIEALKTVLSGNLYVQKSINDKLLNQMSSKPINNGLNIKLTRREHDVLVGISEELTTQEISEKLFISPKTVETHRMNIMSKLGAKNSVGIIKIALEKQLL
ncbi:response regulator transcription factor [Winogradskyella sp.]|jgi:DNA-binding NarL/FixJ family response regulator|uniref:response regulator n=1 Tax=Winogradskyella sp. TaxID=1883156 RepID=UPI0025DD1604|nr:response regulator transcription factor [Winogradskyella sp.]MCT4630404.1 response regulator transcription factor [Winogradskyella sp.]